jgi:hypothetical protein
LETKISNIWQISASFTDKTTDKVEVKVKFTLEQAMRPRGGAEV